MKTSTKFETYGLPTLQWVEVTPGMAATWLAMANRANRRKKMQHISRMARDIATGRWLQTADLIRFDWNGKLIDGQHRLEAIIRTGKNLTLLVVTELDPEVQKVLDANAIRSARDTLTFAGVEKSQNEIAAAARITSGLIDRDDSTTITTTGISTYDLTRSEVADWWAENPDVELLAPKAVYLRRELGCLPSATLAAMLEIHRIDPAACDEFFTTLANMQTNGPGDPRLALIRAFKTISDGGQVLRHHGNAATVYAIFTAWNAWRSGSDLRLIKFYRRRATDEQKAIGYPIPRAI